MVVSSKIEEQAVIEVESKIVDIPILKSFIRKNDTEPIWDGYIGVYKNQDMIKQDFERIHVQVKGKQIEGKFPNILKYDVDINDINSFLNESGSMYFVVLIRSDNKKQIYYKMFLPWTITEIESPLGL